MSPRFDGMIPLVISVHQRSHKSIEPSEARPALLGIRALNVWLAGIMSSTKILFASRFMVGMRSAPILMVRQQVRSGLGFAAMQPVSGIREVISERLPRRR